MMIKMMLTFDTGPMSQSSYNSEMEQESTDMDTGNVDVLDSDDEENRNLSSYLTTEMLPNGHTTKWNHSTLQIGLKI